MDAGRCLMNSNAGMLGVSYCFYISTGFTSPLVSKARLLPSIINRRSGWRRELGCLMSSLLCRFSF